MVQIYADRVRENVTVSGTGDVILGGGVLGYQLWASVMGVGDIAWYVIADLTTGAWEVGLGTYLSGNKLQRTIIIASSSGGSRISFPGNVCDVFSDAPADTFVGAPFLSLGGDTVSGPVTFDGPVTFNGGTSGDVYLYRSYFPGVYTGAQVLDVGKLGVAVTFDSALPGSSIGCVIAPAADALIHILKNGTIEATGTILASATGGTLTSAGWTQGASDAWQVVAPGTADGALAGVFMTLVGAR